MALAVVARTEHLVAPVGPRPVQPVVAFEGVKPALLHAHADERGGIEAQALHALPIGAHMRLAYQHRGEAERAQVVTDGELAHREGNAVKGAATGPSRAGPR